MEIHLVSSLTPDDEGRLAPQLLTAIAGVLDGLPVSYSVRIQTALGDAIHHNHKAGRPLAREDGHEADEVEAEVPTAHV